jgi:ATP-dependent DNA ligase
MLYVDHVAEFGKALFAETLKRDLEGIVAKPGISRYRHIGGLSPWIEIRNPKYSQKEGRADLFNRANRDKGRPISTTSSRRPTP